MADMKSLKTNILDSHFYMTQKIYHTETKEHDLSTSLNGRYFNHYHTSAIFYIKIMFYTVTALEMLLAWIV
jgi:hypothetical protein